MASTGTRNTSYVFADSKKAAEHVIDVDKLEAKYEPLIAKCREIEGCHLESLICCQKIFQNIRNFGVHITKIHRSMEDDVKAGKTFACHLCTGRTYRSTFALQRHYKEVHREMSLEKVRRAVERARYAQEKNLSIQDVKMSSGESDNSDQEEEEREFEETDEEEPASDEENDDDEEEDSGDSQVRIFAPESTRKSSISLPKSAIKVDRLTYCGFCKLTTGGEAGLKRHWRQHHPECDYNQMLSTSRCEVCDVEKNNMRTLATHMAMSHKDYWIFDYYGRHKDNPEFEPPERTDVKESDDEIMEEDTPLSPRENKSSSTRTRKKPSTNYSSDGIENMARLKIADSLEQNSNQSNNSAQEIIKFDYDAFDLEDESEIEEIDNSTTEESPTENNKANTSTVSTSCEVGTSANGTLIRTCSICKEHFNDAPQYREHMKADHSDVAWQKLPQFECPECGKMFSQHSNMRRHHRIHTGESLFDCNICGRGFIQKVALQYHQSTMHSDGKNDCKICGKVFKDSADLKVHIRVHTGRKAGSSVKEIGKTDSIKKEKTPRRSKKDEVKSELTSPAPANDSNRSGQRKRKRKSEIEDMDDEEEDEDAPKTYSCPICTRNVEFTRREFLDQHLLHHEGRLHGRPSFPGEPLKQITETDQNQFKTCPKCGIKYQRRHTDCLAILQRKRPRRPEVEKANHEKMMEELYKNCPFKMKRSKTMRSIKIETESAEEELEPVQKIDRVRRIPREFSCKRIEGTNCTYTTRLEALFREHILTHVTEKLKKEGLLDS